MELRNIALFGFLFIINVADLQAACDVSRCVTTTSASFIQTCKAFTDTMKCMTSKYNACTGTADSSDTMSSMAAAQRPSDCQLDMNQMAASMTARSEMMTAMWKKSSSGDMMNPWSALGGTDPASAAAAIPPFAMMGGDDFMEMDDMMDLDDGPFDDGPFDDDGMGGMMGAALLTPGLFGGSQNPKPAPSPGVRGKPKGRVGAARQVDDKHSDKNADSNTADRFNVQSFLLILLPICVYLDLYLVL